ncbi:hypothetical protein U1Q18_004705 [Sarracenia purpurea var. burkii]
MTATLEKLPMAANLCFASRQASQSTSTTRGTKELEKDHWHLPYQQHRLCGKDQQHRLSSANKIGYRMAVDSSTRECTLKWPFKTALAN